MLISLLLVLSVNSVSATPTIQNMSIEYKYTNDTTHDLICHYNLTEAGNVSTRINIHNQDTNDEWYYNVNLNSSYNRDDLDCSICDDGHYVLTVNGLDGFKYYFTKNQVIQDSRVLFKEDTAIFNIAGPLNGTNGTITIDSTSVFDRYFTIHNNQIRITDSSIGNLGLGTYYTSFIINDTYYDANLVIDYEKTFNMNYNENDASFNIGLSNGEYDVKIVDASNEILYSNTSASVNNQGVLVLNNLPLSLFADEYVIIVSKNSVSHYYKLIVDIDALWDGVEVNVDYKFNTSLTVYIRIQSYDVDVPDNISLSILGTNITDKTVTGFSLFDDETPGMVVYKSVIVLDDLKYLYKDLYKVVSLWNGKLYPAYLHCLSNGYNSISEDEPIVELHNTIDGNYSVDIINYHGILRNIGNKESSNNNLLIDNLPDHLTVGDNYIRLTNVDTGEIFSYTLYVNPVGDINASTMLKSAGTAEFNTTLPNSNGGSAIIYQNMIMVDSISNVNVSDGKIRLTSDELGKLLNGYYDVTFILDENYYYSKLLIKDLGTYTINLGTRILDISDSGLSGAYKITLTQKNDTIIELGTYTSLNSINLPLLFDDEYLLRLEKDNTIYPYTLKIRPYNAQSINQGENGLMKLFTSTGTPMVGTYNYQIINNENTILKSDSTKFVWLYARYYYYGGSINSSDLEPGVYLVKFSMGTSTYNVKLIVNPRLSDKVIGLNTNSVSFNFNGLDNEEGSYTINKGIEEYVHFKLVNGQVTIPTDTLSSGVYYANFIFENGITSGAYIFKNYTRYHIEIDVDNPIYAVYNENNSFIITLKDENNNPVPYEYVYMIENAYDRKSDVLDIAMFQTDETGRIYVNSYDLSYGRTDTEIVYAYQGYYSGGWSADAAYYVMADLVTYSKNKTIESFTLDTNISENGTFVITNSLLYYYNTMYGRYWTELGGQTLYVYVDGELYGSFRSNSNPVQYTVSGLSIGEHTIRVSYQGNLSDDQYAYSEASQEVLVKYYSFLNLTVLSGNISRYGEDVNISFNLSTIMGGLAGKKILLCNGSDNIANFTTGADGLVNGSIRLNSGEYSLHGEYSGEDYYMNSTSTAKSLTISKLDTKININNVTRNITFGEKLYVNMSLLDDYNNSLSGKTVKIRYNDTVLYGVSDDEGNVLFNVSALETGVYNFSLVYDGGDNYVNCSHVFDAGVARLDDPQLNLTVTNSSLGLAPSVSVKLTDTNNNPIKGEIIQFSVNNKPYVNLTTNELGVASFSIGNAGVGNYLVSANIVNNPNIVSASENSSLSVSRAKTTLVISAGTISVYHKVTIKVTLKNSKTGKIIPNKRIRLRINGRNYYKTTSTNGVAVFTISKLKSSSYRVYAYCDNDNNYIASTSSLLVTKKADLYVYKVRRKNNRYTITIRNRGSRASTTTYLKVYYTKSKRTYSKVVKVYGIKIGKTRNVYVNLGKYSSHKRYYKYAYINYPRAKRLVESNYKNNIKKFRI